MGFFNKAAPLKSAAPRATAKNVPLLPVAITGLGLYGHAGDTSRSLISAILGQISGVELSDTYAITLRSGAKDLPRVAPVVALEQHFAQHRVLIMSAAALWQAAATLAANIQAENLLIVTMVDPNLVVLKNNTDQQRLQSYMIDGMRRLDSATFRFLPNDITSATSALQTALTEMSEGKWQAVIFGGADSLISMDSCLSLNDQGRLNTVANSSGIIPGEAAAYIVLQSTDTASKNNSTTLAYLNGLAVSAEPNARDADLKATEGLANAIAHVIAQAGIAATDIQGLVHNLGAETVEVLEWDQTTKKTWPTRVNEQQRMAVQLGELEKADAPDATIPRTIQPYLTMGDTGAAALPMQLATALAWLEYDTHQARWGFPTKNHILVCDTPAATERGALLISKTQTTPA